MRRRDRSWARMDGFRPAISPKSIRDGYWYITGRKKELIVSSNGKKIYPARIENLFKMEPVVNQVLLIGDKRPYVTAVLTLNMPQAQSLTPPARVASRLIPPQDRELRARQSGGASRREPGQPPTGGL